MKILRNINGFSLLEVLVALSVFGIVVVGFSYMFANGLKGSNASDSRNRAVYRAQQTMENSIATYDNSGSDTIELNFSSPITVDGKVITINETYNGINQTAKTVSMTTFVPNQD